MKSIGTYARISKLEALRFDVIEHGGSLLYLGERQGSLRRSKHVEDRIPDIIASAIDRTCYVVPLEATIDSAITLSTSEYRPVSSFLITSKRDSCSR